MTLLPENWNIINKKNYHNPKHFYLPVHFAAVNFINPLA
jgi:hypothetical protein